MRAPRVFKILGFLTGMTAGFAVAAPPLPFVGSVEESPGSGRFVFEVSTPALLLSSSPDGTTAVKLEDPISQPEKDEAVLGLLPRRIESSSKRSPLGVDGLEQEMWQDRRVQDGVASEDFRAAGGELVCAQRRRQCRRVGGRL